ncbi:MAG: nucleotidyltransferase family protein [Candidatus Sulfobium sp.]
MARYLDAEEKACISLSSPNPAPTKLEQVEHSISSGKSFDFRKLLALAGNNGVLPFLYRNLAGSSAIPPEILESLRHAYLATARSNVLNAEETLRIIRSLRMAGIDAIPLKGSIASETLFGDPGLYLATDIDILVRLADLGEAKDVLLKDGYECDEAGERDLLSSHYHLNFHRGGNHVELHWNLAKRYLDVPPAFWWEDTRTAEYNGRSLTTLSPERYLLYAIFRLFDHGFTPLKFLVFISALLDACGHEINYPKLIFLAGKLKMKRLTLFTLRILNEIYGSVPPEFEKLQKMTGYEVLRKRILKGLVDSENRIHLNMVLYMFLLDSPAEVVRILVRRVFPSVGEIRLRYSLSGRPGKIVLYYLLNPMLLATRKQKAVNRWTGKRQED